ncbi:importin-5-like [Populus alba x Populus x berolinensis]|nr:importin-5-like [Populus alba x Populus x berolinensis]
MQEEKHMIKGETLKVLSAVAYSSQDQFAEYYSTVMPYLKVIMMTAKKELDHNLLANSVDCITMVWMAVGKEKIRDDTDMAWSRLGKCLGKEFKPYMSVSIPRLLRSAKIGSYVLIPENPDSVDESDGRIWIKTTVLEEKVAACKGLYLLADELKEGLSVWIEEVAQTLVPFLNFQFNEEIRRVAASGIYTSMFLDKEGIILQVKTNAHCKFFIYQECSCITDRNNLIFLCFHTSHASAIKII